MRELPPWPSKVWRYRTVRGVNAIGWDVLDVFHGSYATVAHADTKRAADVQRDALNQECVARFNRGEQP